MELTEAKAWAERVAHYRFSGGEPEDLAQEILIRYWELQGEDEGIRRYRSRLRATDIVIGNRNYTGSQYRHTSVPALLADEFPEEPWAEPEDNDCPAEIKEAIQSLPPDQQEYVFARFWLNLPGPMMRKLYGKRCDYLWFRAKATLKEKLA